MIDDALLASREIPTSLRDARAFLIRHRSRDMHGRATESTGLVITPTSADADMPVLTWCHGTTGLGDAACPSAQPDPAREFLPYFTIEATQQIDYGVPGAQAFLDAGWVLCATDYQGLGTPGLHQYTLNRTNARDAVNIVHAAHRMGLRLSHQVAAMGWSQGGAAAAAVAELDANDFGPLELIGVVPMSPGVPDIALTLPSGTFIEALFDPTKAPDSHLFMILAAMGSTFAEFSLDDVFTPLGKQILAGTADTQPVHHLNDTLARLHLTRGPILQFDQSKFDALLAAMSSASAGQARPRCPVLVCIDGFAGGTAVPVVWQQQYAKQVTALGGDITTTIYPDDDHFSLPTSCVADAQRWLEERLTTVTS
jgi:pimeloyl-ACP methyl ester carboxylesterase